MGRILRLPRCRRRAVGPAPVAVRPALCPAPAERETGGYVPENA
nr:MAG TPA: hypothetical protein [Caudoviricetes sp.]